MKFDLNVFDKVEDTIAFEILLKFFSEISIEVSRLMNLTLESGLQEIYEECRKAIDKKVTIKNKLIELYRKEKQMPKKVVISQMQSVCPNCREKLLRHYNYCTECGQAIDWKVSE
ncbi:hypothetical protein KQI42_15725 [Tissierella sp. MSJ-40]|uniref:Zinc ribbon domain-containing protein n=1 Tax=Tissierella simiarum TaxID=2841534 RepID=A0ABS6EB92_9FIRM|nr:hypothetical protein [Tissierella simiarum]MBU5439464.1 hypothetical protein [Tissierella simiarum]